MQRRKKKKKKKKRMRLRGTWRVLPDADARALAAGGKLSLIVDVCINSVTARPVVRRHTARLVKKSDKKTLDAAAGAQLRLAKAGPG